MEHSLTPLSPHRIKVIALVALALVIPTSTFATNIVMTGLIAYYLVCLPWHHQEQMRFWREPMGLMTLALVALTVVGSVYSPLPFGKAMMEDHQMIRVVYVPILAWFAMDKHAQKCALQAFVCVMMVSVLLGILRFSGVVDWSVRHTPGAVLKNHIATSLMVALCVYVLLLNLWGNAQWRRWHLVLFVVFLSYSLLISAGRTGLILLSVLMVLGGFQKTRWSGAASVLVLCVLLLVASTQVSALFVERWAFLAGPEALDHSVALRLEFWKNSWCLFLQHPWVGHGTASFEHAYRALIAGTGALVCDNPHQEYLRFLVHYGMLGILMFLLWNFIALRWVWPQRTLAQQFLLGSLIAFLIASWGNSMFMNFSESHAWFFLVAAAWNNRHVSAS